MIAAGLGGGCGSAQALDDAPLRTPGSPIADGGRGRVQRWSAALLPVVADQAGWAAPSPTATRATVTATAPVTIRDLDGFTTNLQAGTVLDRRPRIGAALRDRRWRA
jgi:hypothetical protein